MSLILALLLLVFFISLYFAHLNEFYTRLRHKRGERRARIAVARKLVSYAYWMMR